MIKALLKKYIFSAQGNFGYFGAKVYFPPGSHLFERALQEGIFERDLVMLLKHFVVPGSCFLDIGANIGLMSLPVLRDLPTCKVLSFEPSPSALPFLQRTHSGSPYADRWQIIPKAVSATAGSADFFTAGQANSAFDGLRNTGRFGGRKKVTVPVTTVDLEWEAAGSPKVTAIKIDVEGGELAVLQGSAKCLSTCRPVVFLEWNFRNLAAHECPPMSLLQWAAQNNYQVCQLPHCCPATSQLQFEMQMLAGEEFALLPLSS